MKKLVAYFSPTGTTRKKAEELARSAHADLYEILPKVPYTERDLDWTNKTSRSSVEMNSKDMRPELNESCIDISGYDEVFLGFPLWWFTAPKIINTFLEMYDFRGKKIMLFATSGGSDIGKALSDLRAKYPELNFAGAKLVNGNFNMKLI